MLASGVARFSQQNLTNCYSILGQIRIPGAKNNVIWRCFNQRNSGLATLISTLMVAQQFTTDYFKKINRILQNFNAYSLSSTHPHPLCLLNILDIF